MCFQQIFYLNHSQLRANFGLNKIKENCIYKPSIQYSKLVYIYQEPCRGQPTINIVVNFLLFFFLNKL